MCNGTRKHPPSDKWARKPVKQDDLNVVAVVFTLGGRPPGVLWAHLVQLLTFPCLPPANILYNLLLHISAYCLSLLIGFKL